MRAILALALLVAACGGGVEPGEDAGTPPGTDAACVASCVGTDCDHPNACGVVCTVVPRTGCTYTVCEEKWAACINTDYCNQQAGLCCRAYRDKYPGAPCRL